MWVTENSHYGMASYVILACAQTVVICEEGITRL
jgi:hypothetical protein